MSPGRLLKWRRVLMLLLVLDAVLISAGLLVSYWLRFDTTVLGTLVHAQPAPPVWYIAPLTLIWVAAFAAGGLYQRANLVSGIDEYRRIIFGCFLAVLVTFVGNSLGKTTYIPLGFLAASIGFVTVAVAAGRFGIRRLIYRLAARGRFLDRVIVVGTNRQAVAVARQLAQSLPASAQVIGFVSDDRPIGSEVAPGLMVLGEPMELDEVAATLGATKAVVVESGLSWESLRALVRSMHLRRDFGISIIPSLYELHSTALKARHMGPLLTLVPAETRVVGFDAVMKRVFDITLGLAGLLVAAPVSLAMIATSVIAGRRLGMESLSLRGVKGDFRCWRHTYPAWALDAHLSRIPYLLAIVRGHMSVVGPRAVSAAASNGYGDAALIVGAAKPGFIGPWWLVGMHRPTDIEDELAYDLYYLRNYSIWYDLHIVLQAARGLAGLRVAAQNGAHLQVLPPAKPVPAEPERAQRVSAK